MGMTDPKKDSRPTRGVEQAARWAILPTPVMVERIGGDPLLYRLEQTCYVDVNGRGCISYILFTCAMEIHVYSTRDLILAPKAPGAQRDCGRLLFSSILGAKRGGWLPAGENQPQALPRLTTYLTKYTSGKGCCGKGSALTLGRAPRHPPRPTYNFCIVQFRRGSCSPRRQRGAPPRSKSSPPMHAPLHSGRLSCPGTHGRV
jgi:hypothetical protein